MTEAAEMRLLKGPKRRVETPRPDITPTTPEDDLPQFLYFHEVAAWTRRDVRTVNRWRRTDRKRRRKLRVTRVGGRDMVRKSDLVSFLEPI